MKTYFQTLYGGAIVVLLFIGMLTTDAWALSITTQPPKTPVALLGNPILLPLKVVGQGTITYTWQRLDNGQTNWVNISDEYASGQTYLFVPMFLSEAGVQFRCKVTDGSGATIYSDPSMLLIQAHPRIYAGDDQYIPDTLKTTLTATTPSVAGLTFSWTKLTGSGDITFTNPTSISTDAVFSQPGEYRVRLTVSDGKVRVSDDVKIFAGQTYLLPTGSNVFYVQSPYKDGRIRTDGLPACNDNGPGTLSQPWCTLGRAFNVYKDVRLKPGGTLFIRGGDYRPEMTDFFAGGVELMKDQLSGTPDNPTVITGYPGEKPMILMSQWLGTNTKLPTTQMKPLATDVMPTWQPYAGKAGVYWFPWRDFEKKYRPISSKDDKFINPQMVAIHGRFPILLQQVNAAKTDLINAKEIRSLRTNQNDMLPGDFYYESDATNTANYGKLFVYLPNGLILGNDPNKYDIEVPQLTNMGFGDQHDVIIRNLEVRYSNLGAIGIAGNDNILEDLDLSYHPIYGISGQCVNCLVRNNNFNMNGMGAVRMGGIIENNLMQASNWRGYLKRWDCGMKIINAVTFRGNLVRNTNNCPALWFDYSVGGETVENNLFEHNGYGVMVEVTPPPPYQDDPSRILIIRNNIFYNQTQSYWEGGVYISSSSNVKVYNNLFYNTAGGVIAITDPAPDRRRLKHNSILNNIFYKVTYPVGIMPDKPNSGCNPTDKLCEDVQDNISDNNIYYLASSTLFWDLLDIPLNSPYRVGPHFITGIGPALTLTKWQEYSKRDLNSKEVNPLFVNPLALDFHLQSTSPALRAGVSIEEVTTDMDGNDRSALPDIGPYQNTINTALLYGDVNNDRKVNVIDSALVVKYAVGINLEGFNSDVADVSGDGRVNVIDASMIAQYAIGHDNTCQRCNNIFD